MLYFFVQTRVNKKFYFYSTSNILRHITTHGNDRNNEGNEMCDCVTWPVFFI